MIRLPVQKCLVFVATLHGVSSVSYTHLALSTVRGNQRVTSDNPEATYDTLEKYGYDMVERARQQKLRKNFE